MAGRREKIRRLPKKMGQLVRQSLGGGKGGGNGKLARKTVLLLGLGKHVRGNLRYLLEILNKDPAFRGYHFYVRTVKETDEAVRALITEENWKRTKTVLKDEEYNQWLQTAKILLTETYFPERWVKQPGQILIAIWHGTPLKRIGAAKTAKSCHRNGTAQKNFINADYLLFPNDYTKEKLLDSYRVAPLMHARALYLGYPRTGGMLSVTEEERKELRAKLAPGGERIYAYMPTFRGYLPEEEEGKQIRAFLDAMEAGLSDTQILYVNLHHKLNLTVDYSGYTKIRPFPADPDSYRLLSASDALISDYSSVMFDYLILRRQIILYIPDYAQYEKKRGLYFDLHALPFDKAETAGEVLSALERGKSYDDAKAAETFCPFDSADNARKLSRLLLGDERNLRLEELPGVQRPNVLIHTEWAPKGASTALLEAFVLKEEERPYELFLSANSDLTAGESGAYPMFRSAPVIGSSSDACRYGQMLGVAVFDTILIYDCEDPARIRALAGGEKTKALLFFLQESALAKLEAGDLQLLDAVSFALAKCARLLVRREEDLSRARTLLGEGCGEITLVPSEQKLGEVILGTLFEPEELYAKKNTKFS